MLLFKIQLSGENCLEVYKGFPLGASDRLKFRYNQLIKKLQKCREIVKLPHLYNRQSIELIKVAQNVKNDKHQALIINNKLAYNKFIQLCKTMPESNIFTVQKSENSIESMHYIARSLLNNIKNKKGEIIKTLTEFEPLTTAEGEYHAAVDSLETISIHNSNLLEIGKHMKVSSVFLPINLPLYSFILYAFIPGLPLDSVFIRCPELTRKILRKLFAILEIEAIAPKIKILEMPRAEFNLQYVSQSDLIIFTGEYNNATKLLSQHSDKLFIYNGYGVNPVVVHHNGDLDVAVEKIVAMRTFNSGQDCGAPDAILVNDQIFEQFLSKLKEKLSKLKVGSLEENPVDVGPLFNKEQLLKNLQFISGDNRKVHHGGLLDIGKQILYPIIIESGLEQNNYHEFFAPIFNLIRYKNEQELSRYFANRHYKQNAMYASCFGNIDNLKELTGSIVLENQVILDVDTADNEFGGYGRKVNFIHYKGQKASFPILIPRDIANCLRYDRPVHLPQDDRSARDLSPLSPKNQERQAPSPSSYQHLPHSLKELQPEV